MATVKVNTPIIDKISKELDYLRNHICIVGILSDEAVDGVKIIDYSIANEFGTSKIPARPFFRTVVRSSKNKKIYNRLKLNLSKVATGKMTGEEALKNIGVYVVGLVKLSIKKGEWTPNAESTKQRKRKKGGGSKPPLINTSSMINAVDFEIRRR